MEAEWSWSTLSLHRSHWVEVEILVTCTTGGEEETHLNKWQNLQCVRCVNHFYTAPRPRQPVKKAQFLSWPNHNQTDRRLPTFNHVELCPCATDLNKWGKKAFVVPLRTSPFLAHTNPLCICYYLGGEILGETKQIILVPFQISASVLEGLRAHMFRLRSMKMLKYFTRNRTPTMIHLSHKPSPRSITSAPLLHSPALDIQLPCTELHFCALPILLGDLLWQDPPRMMARSPSQHDHHSR